MDKIKHSKLVLFYRDFRGLTGGHLKVYDYYNHIGSFPGYNPKIHFSRETVWDAANPWFEKRGDALEYWEPERADMLFLAGMDWQMLTETVRREPRVPVINLVQGVRHADRNMQLFSFLKYPAVRICVSQETADAILETGETNGPVRVIGNGVDLSLMDFSRNWTERNIDVLIVGAKNPAAAHEIDNSISGYCNSRLLDRFVERDRLLSYFSESKVVVCLPQAAEGFYLPALEAMASGCLVVCPDCIGNRSFCIPHNTALVPKYGVQEIARTALLALEMNLSVRTEIMGRSLSMANRHSLVRERTMFQKVLNELDSMWHNGERILP